MALTQSQIWSKLCRVGNEMPPDGQNPEPTSQQSFPTNGLLWVHTTLKSNSKCPKYPFPKFSIGIAAHSFCSWETLARDSIMEACQRQPPKAVLEIL